VSFLFYRWELKIAALVMATVLWFWVVTSEKTDLTVVAAVDMESVPAGLEVVGGRSETVDVDLHGLRSVLARLGPDRVRARASLAGAHAGTIMVRLRPDQVVVPAGVSVVRVQPSRVPITLEPSRQVQVPVVPKLVGTVRDGYRVTRVSVTPPEVAIEGPQSIVSRVSRLETQPVSLADATTTIQLAADLDQPAEAAVRFPGSRRVQVVVEIGPADAGGERAPRGAPDARGAGPRG
jgi:YbbR domain-containing protein